MIDNNRSLTIIGEMLPHLTGEQRRRFLLALAQELIIAARDTDEEGSDGVQRPSDLRRYNEVLHRVLANRRGLLEHHCEEVWCWNLIMEASRTLPLITTACHRTWERTQDSP